MATPLVGMEATLATPVPASGAIIQGERFSRGMIVRGGATIQGNTVSIVIVSLICSGGLRGADRVVAGARA